MSGLCVVQKSDVACCAHAGCSVEQQVESCLKLGAYDWLTLLPGTLLSVIAHVSCKTE